MNWKTVLWSEESKYRTHGHYVIQNKRGDGPSSHLLLRVCIIGPGVGNLHIYVGTTDAEPYKQALKTHMGKFFLRKTMPNQNVARKTMAWFHGKRVRVLNRPDRSPDLSPTENI